MDTPDWSLLRSFLAVAETGSLSAAARGIGATQPTVGRHVQALEATLGAELFRRETRGMSLTETGQTLLPHARAMAEAAQALSLTAAGGDGETRGTVRLTASLFVAHHILPPILADIRQAHPDIQIDLVASDASENLLFREADIAVRMYRPRQLDMVTRHLGNVTLGLFAAQSYIDRRGVPGSTEEFFDHDFVGFDRNEDIIRGFRAAGMPIDRSFFSVRCDNQTVYWELVRAGCGLGFAQMRQGARDPDMVPVPLDLEVPTLEVWLTAHETIRRTPRVDAVWRILAERLPLSCDLPASAA